MPKATAIRGERMERKPVMLPPDLIRRTEDMAKTANVSFAEIVRRALMAYDPDARDTQDDTLEALAETLVKSTEETMAYLDRVERQLDATHEELHNRQYGLEQ